MPRSGHSDYSADESISPVQKDQGFAGAAKGGALAGDQLRTLYKTSRAAPIVCDPWVVFVFRSWMIRVQ